MTAPALSERVAPPLPKLALGLGALTRYAVLGMLALGLLYVAWGLYLAGEPLFAVVVMALLIGIVVVFGQRRFYTARFVFPAIAAVLIFIALPVLYTSYVGFTNFGARNLLTFDRVTAYHLNQKTIDKSTERPFALIAADGGHRLFLPEGEGGLLSEPFPLDGNPVTIELGPVAQAPAGVLPMRDVVARRSELAVVTARLPDGSEIQSSGLRSFAR